MINELTADNTYRPKATYILAFCCLMITGGTLMFQNLESIFGARELGGIPPLARLTVPFQHGFSTIPRIVHLSIILILFLLISRPVEKILGTTRFVAFTAICWIFYVLTHRFLEMQGHGFHPIIWTYSILLWYILGEAKYIKTRTSFQETYKLLKVIILSMWIVAPIMMMFIPLHFTNTSETSLIESLWLGNICHILAVFLGIGGILIFKKRIRNRMIKFARKKKLIYSKYDKFAVISCLLVPLFLLAILYINPQ
jgi:membrane associated rhomboid family serine protease